MPQIGEVMTRNPRTIEKMARVNEALELMRHYHFRHLPVLDKGRLVGVITDRDIKFAKSFEDFETFNVGDVMTPDPYMIQEQALLADVASEMSEHKYGCALVVDQSSTIIGIFTSVDALRVLSATLRLSPTERTSNLQSA